MNNDQFKGRKGQKRLKELNDKIEQYIRQTDEHAASSPQMELIMGSIPDPIVREFFADRYRVLDHFWGGVKTMGFLRLCETWIRRKELTELNKQNVEEMFIDILPAEEMQRIRITSNGE